MKREKPRFTVDGSPALEEHLSRTCGKVRDAVTALVPAEKLEALLLGGGYGRGEGGVLNTPEGDKPYNDLEFYLLIKGNCRRNEKQYSKELGQIAHRIEPSVGIEIEFKIISRDKLEQSSPSMFYYDLAVGHRLITGDDTFWDECPQHFQPQNIPLSEAARLLMNRCSGLLFALERLTRESFDAEAADFVGRNQAKAQLAFGDVILAAYGKYHSSCRERLRRLETFLPDDCPLLPEARQHHRAGVDFKLHPRREIGARKELMPKQAKLMAFALELWLWLERRRLAENFPSALEYARSPVNKCPETNGLRNALINVKTFGPAAPTDPKRCRYPRERLFEALALLLWQPDEVALIQERLRTRAKEFQPLVEAYAALWRRFN